MSIKITMRKRSYNISLRWRLVRIQSNVGTNMRLTKTSSLTLAASLAATLGPTNGAQVLRLCTGSMFSRA